MRKRSLLLVISAIVAIVLTINSSYGQNCLVAHYKLDGSAVDYSGNNYDGTLNGTTAVTDQWGNPYSALSFNGISDKVNLPDDFDFRKRTISFWFNSRTFPVGGAWMYDSDHSSLVYGHTQIYVENYGGTNNIAYAVGTNFYKFLDILPNQWYHVAIVVDSLYVKYFYAGNIMDSLANNNFAHSNTGDFFAKLGTTRRDDRYFNGLMDEVRIYNCALSAYELNQIYASTKENHRNDTRINIYPNPTSDILNIYIPEKAEIEIMNLEGQVIKRIISGDSRTTVDISDFAKGMYYVKVKIAKEITVNKFIKD